MDPFRCGSPVAGEHFTGREQELVGLAAHPPQAVFSAAFARRMGLANAASVRRALDALADDETVDLRGGSARVVDPFLARWLTERPD